MGEVGCLKDGNFQNLQVEGIKSISGNLRYKRNIISGLANTRTFTAEESGSIILLDDNTLDGNFTLPPAEAGLEYYFVCSGTMAGATIACAGASDAVDVFFGTIKVVSTTDNNLSSDENIVMTDATGAPTNHKKITLTGSSATSGGIAGDVLRIVAITDDAWLATGVLGTTNANPGTLDIIGVA